MSPYSDKTILALLCTLLTVLPVGGRELIDPTRPAIRSKTPSIPAKQENTAWSLDSIIVAPDRRVAVINGQQVSEGDSVDNARVIKIQKLDVLIETSKKRQILLQLLPDIITRQP